MKSIVIDNTKFRYNKDKPISNVLTKKLWTVKKANEYRSYAFKIGKGCVQRRKSKRLTNQTRNTKQI